MTGVHVASGDDMSTCDFVVVVINNTTSPG